MCENALAELQQENERTRVTLWRLPPGTATGWHVHGFDYVVVPVQGGLLTVETREGRFDYPVQTAKSYARDKGVEHNIRNTTDAEIAFVEVEIKD